MLKNRTCIVCFAIVLIAVVSPSASRAAAQDIATPTAKIPVILSTDVGNEIDDQWAVVQTLLSPEFEVLGVISAQAPSIPAPAGDIGLLLLRDIVESRMGMREHPPLLAGANDPLINQTTPQESEGARFIVEASKPYSPQRRVRVLTIGAMTDVASAILLDPGITSRIEVVDMGFNNYPAGGDLYNILNDIKAAQIIFASDVPVVVGCADVCRESLSLTLDEVKSMLEGRGPVAGWLMEEFLAHYYRFVKPLRKNDFTKKKVIWDNIVVAYLLGMTQSEAYDRPKVKDDAGFEVNRTGGKVIWIKDVDEKKLWADLLKKIDRHTATTAIGF